MINPLDHKIIQGVLEKLSFVQWDRFSGNGDYAAVYGWIDRETDSYKDFVILIFFSSGGVEFHTSSSKYSLEIHKILNGEYDGGHNDCERVEKFFNIPNMVKLK